MKTKLIDALYCRVSTDMQREKGESIKNQISRLTEYVNGSHNKIKIYEDAGYSAKDTNRPAINRLLIDIKEGKLLCNIIMACNNTTIESLITKKTKENMHLRVGDNVTTLIKSSELFIKEVVYD